MHLEQKQVYREVNIYKSIKEEEDGAGASRGCVCVCVCVYALSCVQLFVISWTVACFVSIQILILQGSEFLASMFVSG